MRKFFEKEALLAEFSYATEFGCVLTYKDIEAILDHFDDCEDNEGAVIELAPQVDMDGLKRKYIVLKSDTGEIVDNCFVLRPDKDAAAIVALVAYAKSTGNKKLANDILRWIDDISGGC